MANYTINDLTENTAPPSTAELEIQLTGGGASRRATLNNVLKSITQENFTSATDTLTAAESGKVCTNLGTSVAVTLTLPVAADGLVFTFVRWADYSLKVDPNGTDTILGGGSGKYLELQSYGAVQLRSFAAGSWVVMSESASWNFEV